MIEINRATEPYQTHSLEVFRSAHKETERKNLIDSGDSAVNLSKITYNPVSIISTSTNWTNGRMDGLELVSFIVTNLLELLKRSTNGTE